MEEVVTKGTGKKMQTQKKKTACPFFTPTPAWRKGKNPKSDNKRERTINNASFPENPDKNKREKTDFLQHVRPFFFHISSLSPLLDTFWPGLLDS